MKKLNKTAYTRLKAQADEANEIGLTKLANGINNSLADGPREEDTYVTEKVDATKIDTIINSLTKTAFEDIKSALNVKEIVSPREMPLPGEYNFEAVQKIVNEFKKEYNVQASVKVIKNDDGEKYSILTFAGHNIPNKYKSVDIEVI